ncbi:MAG TPA: siroheme synthase [Caulobacteraceae bacterium]
MDAFPAFFPLAGRKVVIAGAGEAAEAKARLFEGAPCELVRIEGEAAFDRGSYAGALMAFVTDPAAGAAARAAGALVNVIDRPELSDFTTPAIVDRGEVVAAVGTGGASPMLATMLRGELEARLPQRIGQVAATFREMQDELRAALPDLTQRRAFLRRALEGEITADGLREALKTFRPDKGEVLEIDASGPADLITLRALRALGAADVLIVEPGANGDIAAMARRDAERREGLSPSEINELVSAGKRIVRLTSSAHPRESGNERF